MSERTTVNMAELARALDTDVRQVQRWLERWPEFPVVTRGDRGVAYAFDLDAVRAFVAERRAVDAATKGEPGELTPQQELQRVRAEAARFELEVKRGDYVLKVAVAEALQSRAAQLGRRFDRMAAEVARPLNLPDAVVRALQDRIDGWRRDLVAEFAGALEEVARVG